MAGCCGGSVYSQFEGVKDTCVICFPPATLQDPSLQGYRFVTVFTQIPTFNHMMQFQQ